MKRLCVLVLLFVFAVPASATTTRILPAQDAWPVWSPAGDRIAFTRILGNSMALELVRLGPHGSVTQVARNSGQLTPSWSADGTQLAYAAFGHIYVVAADGSHRQQKPFAGAAYAPAFRPGGTEIAYLTTHGAHNLDLWVDDALRARNVIGRPAWAGDGLRIAFQRDDGIYVSYPGGVEKRLASVANPGPPVFVGDEVFYTASGRVWRVASTTGGRPEPITRTFPDLGTPSFAPDRGGFAFTWRGGLEIAQPDGSFDTVGPAGLGAAYGADSSLAYAGPRSVCPGHVGLHLRRASGSEAGLTGSCTVTGTARGDVIEGSPREGDVILAGAGNDAVHANDGHTDRVDCGPGRDVVWADRLDKLSRCEVVHR